MRVLRYLVPGRLNFFARTSRHGETGSGPSVSADDTPSPVTVGRRVPEPAAAYDTAALLFSRDFSAAPPSWGRARICGVATAGLLRHLSAENQECIALSPGWAEAVVHHYDCHFFVVETAAFYRGTWFGALEPGGEHLLDEILALAAAARDRLMTPLLIENHPGHKTSQAASLTLSPPLERLRGALPARLSPDGLASVTDPYAPTLSAPLDSLARYTREGGGTP